MTDSVDKLPIEHNEISSRFEIHLDEDSVALLQYIKAGSNVVYHHTEVPEDYEGMGIGSRLARHALDYAREHGWKVQALCPFVSAYVREHEEYQDIVWGYEK